ncbi:MAG TPA: DUF4332 domain-containing protein [Micromonosporaceae bacterium]|nr:DUF4332 domain-containing protein [Micromonosporaceae bacterium]
MAWFIGQSTVIIVLAFALGLAVGWLLWARRIRALTVEVAAARIRAAGRGAYAHSGRLRRPGAATTTSTGEPFRRRGGWPRPRMPRPGPASGMAEEPSSASSDRGTDPPTMPRIPLPRIETVGHVDPHVVPLSDLDDEFSDDLADGEFADRDFADDLGFGSAGDHDADTRFRDEDFERGDARTRRDNADPLGLSRYRDLFGPPEAADETPNRDPIAKRGLFGQRTSADDVRDHAIARKPDVDGEDPDDVAANRASGYDAAIGDAVVHDAVDAGPHGDADNDVAHELALIEAVAARRAVDDFTRITGVGPKSAAALVAAGIRTYDQLADTVASRVADALRDAGLRLAPNLRTWPGQARLLTDGDRPTLSGRGRGPMSINHRGDGNAGTNIAPAPDGSREHNGRPDRYGRPDGPVAGPNRPPAVDLPRRSVPPDALDPDDLARIEGIGPRFAAALVTAGIRTFGQLAASDVEAIRNAVASAGLIAAPSLPTWPAQARLLADGDEDGFAVMTARLIAGRDVRDNLERIAGIGPRVSAALRVAGIHTFRALANSDTTRLRTAIKRAGMPTALHLATWPAQARLLADGDEEAFGDLAGRLGDGDAEDRTGDDIDPGAGPR